MTPELQEYYEKYSTLFSSDGWKQLTEEVTLAISSLEKDTFLQGKTDVFLINKGQLTALNYIMNYPQLVEASYEELTREPDDVEDF